MGAQLTDQHEPSYYEIALTNRQVLIAFVVLLVCLLVAFLSGVWVGRGRGPVEARSGAPPAAPAAGQERPLEEYRFFSEEGKRPTGPAAAATAPAPSVPPPPPLEPAPGPGTTLVDDVGGADVAGRAGQPAPPAPPQGPGDAEPGATAPAAPAPVAAPPAPVAAPPAAPETAPPAGTELREGEMVIQVFSSPDEPQARRILDRLTQAGFGAFLSPVRVGSQTMHRVRIGPFTDRAEAQRIADQVKKQFRLDTWITR
jgi:cell division septation protein DedD